MDKITIVGGGLVGSLLSIYLAKRNYKVDVYERRPDMRKEEISAGRSINLALSDRGWHGLEGAGIADEIRKIAIPMKGRMMHDLEGKLTFQPYGNPGQAIFSVSRGELNMKMVNLAEAFENVTYHFNERCVGVNLETATSVFENQNTGERKEVKADRIIGTDGAFSAVRLQLQMTDRFNYSQDYLKHGYKELNIPPADSGGWRIEKNALHIWPRGNFMLIALPNEDGSFTCTLFFPFEGEQSFETLRNENDVLSFFNEVFPDAVPLMPTLTEDYFSNPTSSLAIIRCFPWSWKDKVLLMGDASHAIVPFYGQGMNSGFEDVSVFEDMMNTYGDDWERLFKAFEASRKPNADAIADLALQNFIEMRDRVADPQFLLQKKIEAKLSEIYPDKWLPLYSQVTFSDIPYAEALAHGKLQEAIMKEVMTWPNIENNWQDNVILTRIIKMIDEPLV